MLELLRNNQPVTACRQKNSDISRIQKLFACYTPDHEVLFRKIKWVEADVRDIFSIDEALEGIHNVYHCAGFVSFRKKDRKKLAEINEQGTANVVNACLGKKQVALCHVSSIATINNSDHTLPLDESVFWKTSGRENEYAISKYNGEREVWRGIEEGLDAVIVNPGVILAPGFWNQSSSKIFDACHKGNRFYTDGMSAYIAAADVAKAMVGLMNKRLFANRYILAENNYSFRHILSSIHTRLQQPAPSIRATPVLLRLAAAASGFWSFFSGREARITKALMNAAFNQQLYSSNKIKAALKIEFTPVDEAISAICRQYLSEKSITASSSLSSTG